MLRPHIECCSPPPPGPEHLPANASRPLLGMFRQVSGERGGRLPGGRQGGPQRPEESTAAETPPAVPVALTPRGGHSALRTGLTGPGPSPPRDPAHPQLTKGTWSCVWSLWQDSLDGLELSPFPAGALTRPAWW